MALDICVESYGIMVHAFDTGLFGHLSNLANRAERLQPWRRGQLDGDLTILEQVDVLPFNQAKALWLIDVCGCSYEEAAHDMQISRGQVADHVSGGRSTIRTSIQD